MEQTIQVKTDTVMLAPAAVQAVRDLLAERKMEAGFGLRVYIAGRSCSGLQYGMALDNDPGEQDSTFESDGIKVIIDNQSLEFMRGATVEFVDDERGKGFLVDNPNTPPACSCESSSCGN
ncbi:MAG: iron-sulfur cluster assembly accessory protein [Chloroflexi bacterium]|nr:iron-sulfur cluster assembly accessory protein [Chloroflexota bacterium]